MNRRTWSTSVAVVLLLVACSGMLVSCGSGGAALEESRQMNDTMATLQQLQPAPYGHTRSDAREALIQIEEAMIDSSRDMYHYVQAMDGHPVFHCTGKGLGIPDTAELSNPEQLINPYSTQYVTMPQADPYGYYAPSTSQGTYILCNNTDGTQYLQRWEANVVTSSVPLRWNKETQEFETAGPSTMRINLDRAPRPAPTKQP